MTDVQHEAAGAKARVAEVGVARVRAGVVLLNSIVYLVWLDPGGVRWLAYTTIVVANLYSLFVMARPPKPGTALASATWTTGTDAFLIVIWLTATGGADSLFYLLWALSLVAISFRFGATQTRLATVAYVALDATLLYGWGALNWDAYTAVRLGYLFLLGILGSYVASSNMDSLRRERALARAVDEAARNQSEVDAIMKSAPSIIIRCDLDGRIQYVNRAAQGVDAQEVIGASIYDFVDEAGRKSLEKAVRHVRSTGQSTAYELDTPGEDGRVYYRSSMGPVHRGKDMIGLVILTQDITQERVQALEVERAKQQAADIEHLQKQDAFRRRLLNSVAHELNTPLTPLRLQLAMMAREDSNGVARMSRNVDRLEMLVRDLLDLARMERGVSLHREVLQPKDLLKEAAANFEPLAKRRGLVIDVALQPVELVADPLRVMQVLSNLISNAIRFSPDQTRIQVGARPAEEGCELYVADQGLGLDEEQLQQVFEPFEQVHASLDADLPGTGLGLHITRSIMEAHGGRIQVTSKGRGKGSRFSCWFPPVEQAPLPEEWHQGAP